jgi:hypothetical protein
MDTKLIMTGAVEEGGRDLLRHCFIRVLNRHDPANSEVRITDSSVGINKSYFHTQSDNNVMVVCNILP